MTSILIELITLINKYDVIFIPFYDAFIVSLVVISAISLF